MFTPGANTVTGQSTVTGCIPVVTFGTPTSGTASWTVNLSASASYTNAFETITETGAASPVSIGITTLPAGAYITELVDSNGQTYTIINNAVGITTSVNNPLSFTIYGLVNGAMGTPSTTFTVTNASNQTTMLTTNNASTSTPSASWTPPVVNGTNQGNFTITMKTTAG